LIDCLTTTISDVTADKGRLGHGCGKRAEGTDGWEM